MTTFDDIHSRVAGYQGWLRPEQARALWDAASRLGPGDRIVEIGSFHGKSTVILATAAPEGVEIFAIDPFAGNDRGPGEWHGAAEDGQSDFEQFSSHLRTHDVDTRVQHVREFSQNAHDGVPGDIDLLYIDGAHGYAPALDDIVTWGDRTVDGATMAIHDVYTSFFVSLAVMRKLWFSRQWTYLGRERSMALYRREPVSGAALVTNAARQAACVPWFLKNMVVKAATMAGLGRFVQRGYDPRGGLY